MSSNSRANADAGASTDQHVTGGPETEVFPTDEPPVATTPSHGSSNAGINTTRANRVEPESERIEREERE
ncbi:hypothetical protein [Paractinoplanes rishiriensis]|uniref:Uncharacterized protein n=1 Tax=Paractinoplanes rishiriensis TaxID=1050105 RepID=A0A919K3M2_9ACTN|nr:hypothetical protein [Actinoplanes rishiriensis]GIE99583.1 hypothetical protein Ari01nite_70480 [Actinoplanes rishiriensis]